MSSPFGTVLHGSSLRDAGGILGVPESLASACYSFWTVRYVTDTRTATLVDDLLTWAENLWNLPRCPWVGAWACSTMGKATRPAEQAWPMLGYIFLMPVREWLGVKVSNTALSFIGIPASQDEADFSAQPGDMCAIRGCLSEGHVRDCRQEASCCSSRRWRSSIDTATIRRQIAIHPQRWCT